MKILTGKLKGRNFYMPHGIRPSPNIIRKAMFDVFGQDLKGIEFLDLFAGSGAVGLEAMSCGAQRVTFIENDPVHVQVIEDNLKLLGIDRSSNSGPALGGAGYKPAPPKAGYEVIQGDTFYAIKQLAKIKRKFDFIFIDPPYGAELAKKTLNLLSAYDILTPDCYIVVQHDKWETLPESEGRFFLIRQKKYGTSFLAIYEGKLSLS